MARLDDYQLVRVLAHGGMGVVHEAVERATGRRVALKRLLGPLDRDLVARLLVEGRALARLDHPAIVRVHALDEAPGGPFMVMDLVAGESLDRVLRREGPLAPERARAIVVTLTEALDHAHAHGVLHRDLKPANVLVTPDDEVKLIDFGLAKLQVDGGSLGHLTRTGEMLGTPGYMAPEQADGRPVDARTDVYGLGATLHALLTGRAPFEGPNAIAILEGVLTRQPLAPSRLRPGVPRALDEVVLACLAKDPAERPSTMSALRERLVGGPARRGARRVTPPSVLVATAGTIVVAAAAGAWWATRPTSSDAVARPRRVAPVASSTTAAVDTRRAALEVAERAVRARPDDPEAWLDLARERARQGDLTGALAAPPADAPRAAWIAHARALLSAGRLDDALSALPAGDDRELVLLRFQAVVARCEGDATRLAAARERPEVVALAGRVDQDPRWADGLFERERYLLLLSSDQARAEGGAEALRALGAHVHAERLLAAAALPRGDPLAALRRLDAAIARSSATSAVLSLERGHALVMAGRLDEAELELTRAIELEPLSLRAWRDRGGCRLTRRRLREAAADAVQEVALQGPAASPTLRLRPAELLLAGGHLEEARRALEAVPGSAASASLLRVRGDLLQAEGDLAGATRAYEQVLAGDLLGQASDFEHASQKLAALGHQAPPWREAYVRSLRGVDDPSAWTTAALFLQRDAELAEKVASRAIELGADVRAYVLRATVRGRLRRPWEALADHDQVVARTAEGSPDRVHALLNRSATRATVGDLVGALQDLRAAGALDSTGRLAKEIERERERLERELAALAEAAAAATHAIRGTVQSKAALERLQAAAPYRAESTRLKLVYVWTLRAIGRALPDRRMVDTAERVLDDLERAGALPERARALRRRFDQDEVDVRRAEGDDPVARVRGLLALRRYPEAVDALSALAGHPAALQLELELARCLRAAGDLENARTRYQRLDVEEGTDAWWEVVLGVAEVVHDTDQTTPELLKVLEDLSRHPGPHRGRAALEHARALLVVGRSDEALEAARRAEALTEAALSATAADDERARDALRGPLVEAALLRGRALLALERRREARDALQGAALLASLLSLDEHHRLKADVRRCALEAFEDDDALVRAAHLAFP